MSQFVDFITGYFFIAAVSAWLSSVIIKWIIYSIRGEKHSLFCSFSNGGMPSSHSAFVSSASAAIFMIDGLSSVFYLSLLIALIVMSDAFRVRRNLGVQGDSLNKLLLKLKQNPVEVVHGHSFFQVCIGALWGVLVAIGVFYLI